MSGWGGGEGIARIMKFINPYSIPDIVAVQGFCLISIATRLIHLLIFFDLQARAATQAATPPDIPNNWSSLSPLCCAHGVGGSSYAWSNHCHCRMSGVGLPFLSYRYRFPRLVPFSQGKPRQLLPYYCNANVSETQHLQCVFSFLSCIKPGANKFAKGQWKVSFHTWHHSIGPTGWLAEERER